MDNAAATITVSDPSPTTCPYEDNLTSADKLCELWCQLESYNGHYCCPKQYNEDVERLELCSLWSELEHQLERTFA